MSQIEGWLQVYRAQTEILLWLQAEGCPVNFAPGQTPLSWRDRNEALRAPQIGMPKRTLELHLRAYHGEPCPYCRVTMLIGTRRAPSRDHVHPKSMGGTLTRTNRRIVCRPCNGDKGNLPMSQWLAKLERAGDPRAIIVRDCL